MSLGVVILSVASTVQAEEIENRAGSACIDDRQALLELGQDAFDQDLEGGWRPFADRRECRTAAADLIAEYRRNRLSAGASQEDVSILFWHEAQLRAMEGDASSALPLFESAYSTDSDPTWIHYAEATVAFLRRDRAALEGSRRRLAAVPTPSDFEQRAAEMLEEFDFHLTWPPNLDVVDGLLACFDEPYLVAYGAACRPPQEPSTTESQDQD